MADEIATAYGDNVVFPHRVVIDEPDSDARRFVDWVWPVLVLADENQGVCSWGVSLEGESEGAVVVGGELPHKIHSTIYCDDLEAYVGSRRWDSDCLGREPLLQAQASPLDPAGLEHLTARFTQRWTTRAWPCRENLRFERQSCD